MTHFPFLALGDQHHAEKILSGLSAAYLFDGGYEGAERRRLSVFPEERPQTPPVAAVRFSMPSFRELSHRDFLGALMSLNIERRVIGDIAVGKGEAYVFLLPEKAELAAEELKKVGSVGVRGEVLSTPPELSAAQNFEAGRGTVSGARLDAVAAEIFHLSRAEAQRLIDAGKLQLDGLPCERRDREIEAGAVLSCRGIGKAVVDDLSGISKKGKIILQYRRYK